MGLKSGAKPCAGVLLLFTLMAIQRCQRISEGILFRQCAVLWLWRGVVLRRWYSTERKAPFAGCYFRGC